MMKKVSVLFSLLLILSLQVTTYAEITPVADRTTEVQDAIVTTVGANSANDVTDEQLATITSLNLRAKGITELKSGDFSGMSGLTNLSLYDNELSSLPDGIFEGLTALTTLRLGGNIVDPFPITVTLEKVSENQLKAVIPTGATFDIVLPVTVSNGSLTGVVTTLTISKGSTDSNAVTVSRTAGTTAAVTANIGTLPSLPNNHYGYALSKSDILPLEAIAKVSSTEQSTDTPTDPADETDEMTDTPTNTAPSFTDGRITIRSVSENTATDVNIGSAFSAADAENDTLTYSLSGVDADSFSIVSTTGQLTTKVPLDFETKRIYRVTVTVSDGSLTDSITVIVSIIDVVDDTPSVSTILAVSERTPEVRDAIVAAIPDINVAADVTVTHLAAITSFSLRSAGISELRTGDFSGLKGLTDLNLYGNMLENLPVGIFEGLTSLTTLRLGGNLADPMPLIVSLQQVTADQFQAVVHTGAPFNIVLPIEVTNGMTSDGNNRIIIPKGSVKSDTFTVVSTAGVSSPISIEIGTLPSLPANHYGYILARSAVCNRTLQVADAIAAAVSGVSDCNNVTELDLATITSLDLSSMSINALKANDFSGLLLLSTLNLSNNLLESLPDGIFAGLTSLTSLDLSGNTVDPLPLSLSLEKVGENQFKVITLTGAPFDIVLPITVANGSLSGNATTLTILQGNTESAVVNVTRTPGTSGAVTVDLGTLPSLPTTHTGYTLVKSNQVPLEILPALNVAPEFTEGESTTRSIAERTVADVNIGIPVSATDADDDSLTYTLGGTDAESFSIDGTTGQLKTKAELDYETKTSYSVTITVSDGLLSETIDVAINITDVVENRAPSFTEGGSATRIVAENTSTSVDIGSPVSATDPDDDTLTYSLSGTDASTFNIDSTSGQIRTKSALDYETKSSYSVTVDVSDGELSDSITVTINVTDLDETVTDVEDDSLNTAPVFTDGSTTTRSIAENTGSGVNIGSPVSATDADEDTLTYSLGGTDAASFSISSANGQLRTNAALDYETKSSYSVSITVSDGNDGSDTISVTINITDIVDETNTAPVFTDGSATSRSVLENTGTGVDIGDAVSATDDNDDTLTYSLSGTDASSFSIDSSSGQLRTSASLDYETKSSYSVTMTVSDGNGGSDSITITINITDVDETANTAPVFTEGSSTSRTIDENTGTGVDIGSAVSATDVDNNTLTYSLGGTDASSFSIDSSSGQLRTSTSLDYETKSSYSVTMTVSDGAGGSDSITITINITDVDETANTAPVFTEGSSTSRTIDENTGTGVDIGSAVSATDVDNNTLTYSLGGTDASSFSIDSSSGQLRTSASLDYETKSSYSVTMTVSDGAGGSDSIAITINVTDVDETTNSAPVFTDGSSTTRSIDENTGSGVDIGSAISATDADNDTLTYSLGGTDGSSFSIDSSLGQLRTSTSLDYETKSSYTVTISVSDGAGGSASITVTIDVNDIDESPANNAPVFTDGSSTTRTIAENTATNVNIGSAVSATDADDDTLSYGLIGTDASSFSIDNTTGQLKTKAALNFETKASYKVTVSASDGQGGSTSINVTINITNVNEAPVFTEGTSTTRSIAENASAGINIGSAVSATDVDSTTLTYTLGGTNAASFDIESTTGQLKTKAALDYETKTSYTVTITVSDGSLTDSIAVTINVRDLDETPSNIAPVFTDGNQTTRTIPENTATNTAIGDAIAATDEDSAVLAYLLSGTDASSFTIDGTTGQLKTSAVLNFETKAKYTVTVTVSDGSLTDKITVTINVTNVNEAPVFTAGATATRSVTENTAAETNIGAVLAATDPDANDTLTYSLGGTDAASFNIVSTSGQLKTKVALDYETKTSYEVTVTATDSGNATDTISVTINVSDVNENRPPAFASESTTRSIAENTGAGVNIGAAVSATDPDTDGTLEYSLGGTDAASFDIGSTNGQIRTKAALDYETKSSYSVTVSVSDGNGGTDSISVTINVSDVNENRPPTFTSESTTRSIAENTGSGVNIGDVVSATDPDTDDTLEYSLGGTDAASFDIGSTNGQIRTKAALDYETKASYSVTVSVSDGNGGTDSIAVTINVSDVNENLAPVFASESTTRSIAENTGSGVNIGDAVSATDPDTDDTLEYSLGGTDAASFDIGSTNGQIRTKAALDYETKASYSVTVSVSDGNGGTDSIAVTINVSDVNENLAPVFASESTTRSIAENTGSGVNIGDAVSATDPDTDDTLEYSLGGTDAASFDIGSTNGQIRTKAALDYETKTSYSITVSVSDGNGGTDSIAVTINITDVTENRAPTFSSDSATRSIAENTGSGVDIGDAVSATDPDTDDTLEYSLGGTDASSFSIDSSSGQIRTNTALNYETKASYSVTVSVSDGNGGTDSIAVTINITDVNEAPTFKDSSPAARSIVENTTAGTNIGSVVSATDPEGDSITYGLGGTDAASFSIDSSSGQLKTKTSLDHEDDDAYVVTVIASDDDLSTSITVNISITDVNEAPTFTENSPTTRSIAEHTASGQNIGSAVSATDPEGNTLTYTLEGTDASSFSIVSTSGQLQTNAALDYETKTSYSVAVKVSDSSLTDTISVTINVTDVTENRAPSFSDSSFSYRISDIENASVGDSIGDPVTASDADDDTLSYSVGGDDAALFDIDSSSGQLKITQSLIDHSSSAYSIKVIATDPDDATAEISGTIFVTRVSQQVTNNPPIFDDGESTTRSVAENTASGQNIGSPITATDDDADDTLTYSLEGTDAASFSIVSTSGQLQTSAALDYETKNSYSVTVKVTDDSGASNNSDTITVTINVTDVMETEIETLLSNRTAAVRNAILNAIEGVDDAADVTETHLAAITGTLNINQNENIKSNGLKSGDFEGLTSLTGLSLTGNELTILPDGIFEDLTSLTTLDLTGNELTSLPDDIFDNLTSLTTLKLISNDITTLPDGIFDNLTSLTLLDFFLNELTTLPDGIFDNLTSLTHLNLDFTEIASISATIFDNLTSLKILEFEAGNLTSLPEGVFDNLTALTRLDLDGHEISILPDGIFKNLTNLEILELDSNELSTIPAGTFAGLTNIKELYLYGNAVEPLPINIDFVTVPGGKIKAVAPIGAPFELELPIIVTNGIISGGATGVTIAVGATESETITVTRAGSAVNDVVVAFGNMPSLPSGHMGYSLIKGDSLTLSTENAVGITSVSERTAAVRDAIVAKVSGVTDAADVTETHLAAITGTLDLSSNSNLQSNGIKSGDFHGLTSLTGLNLSDNNLNTPPTGIFSDLTSLTHLNLSSNNIQTLGNNFIDNLTSLKILELESASLTSLPTGIFDNLTALTKLDLDSNNISSLPDGIFKNLTNLEILELDGNDLSAVPTGTFVGLTNITELKLGGNTVDPLSINLTLEFVSIGKIKVVAPIGLPFEFDFPITVTNGSISGGGTGVTIAAGATNSETITIIRTPGTTTTVTAAFGDLPDLPSGHEGYSFTKENSLTVFRENNDGITPVSERTASVRDAIVAKVSGVDDAADVTSDHLLAITGAIDLIGRDDIRTNGLKSGDFDGLTSLTGLNLVGNKLTTLPDGIFDNLTSLTTLNLSHNDLTTLPDGIFDNLTNLTYLGLIWHELGTISGAVFDNLTSLKTLELKNGPLTSLPEDVFDNLTALTTLDLQSNKISTLPDEIFKNLTNLERLELDNNELSAIPAGTFVGLTSLTNLYLDKNKVNPLPLDISLVKVSSGEVKAVAPTGVPFSIDLPVYVQDGSISGDVTSITIPKGSTDSSTFTVTRNGGSAGSVVVVNSGLPNLPSGHDGYSLIKPSPIIVIDGNNAAPYFPDGLSTTRFVNENAEYDGEDFDDPVTAIDLDGDSLTYSLGGTDASKFHIDSTTGQLQTNEVFLSYKTLGWSRYNVTVIATDDSGADNASTSINVRIQVTEDKSSAPLSSLTSQNYMLQIPDTTAFLPNYPNPFNPETWIPYQLSKTADVSLTIYDMRGIVVRELKLGHQNAGFYRTRDRAAHWDGRNTIGERVATGVYFVTFKAGNFTATRKLLIRK